MLTGSFSGRKKTIEEAVGNEFTEYIHFILSCSIHVRIVECKEAVMLEVSNQPIHSRTHSDLYRHCHSQTHYAC